jgi:hypothetical protein
VPDAPGDAGPGGQVSETDVDLEQNLPPTRPWYRRGAVRWPVAAVGGFVLGWLYSTFVGCHGT